VLSILPKFREYSPLTLISRSTLFRDDGHCEVSSTGRSASVSYFAAYHLVGFRATTLCVHIGRRSSIKRKITLDNHMGTLLAMSSCVNELYIRSHSLS
jgi:hypothetical protein